MNSERVHFYPGGNFPKAPWDLGYVSPSLEEVRDGDYSDLERMVFTLHDLV